jgi:hypothetical protein
MLASPGSRQALRRGGTAEDAVLMDITTVNDRHLYRGRVVVQDPADPSRQVELLERVVRFGPAGWLTVLTSTADGAAIELYPTGRVLAVTDLREAAAADGGPGGM